MNLSNRTVWQQAAGDTDRDYSDLCLKWDVILNGPGYAGPWPDCLQELEDDGMSKRKGSDLRRFCEVMADGDIVVLRLGTTTILGVGQVVGSYEWRDEFGDVDGWEIQHLRRVRWLWRHDGKPKKFETYTLKQGDTTQLLDSERVLNWLSRLSLSPAQSRRRLVQLPGQLGANRVEMKVISEFLFDHGVASDSIEDLVNEMDELVRISEWYKRTDRPSEHETVTYLVTPLLRALGWTPQKMAIEWNRLDLALFDSLPRTEESLAVVVEAKKMQASCLSAVTQAQAYAPDSSNCRRLIVTDGLRYGVFLRDKKAGFRLHAYLNLTRLMDHYPILQCKGAQYALLAMAPEWKGD